MPKKNSRLENQILGNCVLGLNFFSDFGAQIEQPHFLIIWQDGQMPYQSIFMIVAQMAPMGISQFLGPKSKKNSLSIPGQIGNIVV